MSSDAEPIRGVTLTGEFERFRAQRLERLKLNGRPENTLDGRTPTAGLSDEELMALVTAQDADALDTLFMRHSRLVYSIALRILRDSGEAEEVVQECFLYVFRKAFSFNPSRGSARVWIVQVAYSRARDRKAHLVSRGYYLNLDIESDEVNGTLAGRDDVEREIGARVDLDRLKRAFGDLSEAQRRTLEMFYFEGLEMREISERLEEPLGNVRHHFYRALERLRKSAIAEKFRSRRDARN